MRYSLSNMYIVENIKKITCNSRGSAFGWRFAAKNKFIRRKVLCNDG